MELPDCRSPPRCSQTNTHCRRFPCSETMEGTTVVGSGPVRKSGPVHGARRSSNDAQDKFTQEHPGASSLQPPTVHFSTTCHLLAQPPPPLSVTHSKRRVPSPREQHISHRKHPQIVRSFKQVQRKTRAEKQTYALHLPRGASTHRVCARGGLGKGGGDGDTANNTARRRSCPTSVEPAPSDIAAIA